MRSEESRATLAQRLGDKVEIITTGGEADGNHKATAHADVVLLGVKPYGIVELARDIAPALAPNAVVVSVAAGVTLETLAECLPAGQPIVRCMPNTPSSVGKGVLAISTTDTVKDEQKKLVEEVLGTVGLVVEVREDQMDAYAFLLAEAMAIAGEKLGLDADTALKLASATVAGAGFLLDTNPDAPALRRAVTSPNGTTERALNTFVDGGLFQLAEDAMRACAARSAEMSQLYTADED